MNYKLQLRLGAVFVGLFVTMLWLVPLVAWAATDAATVAASLPVVAPVAPAAPTTVPVVTPVPAVNGSKALWQTLLLPIVSVLGLFIAAFLTLGLKKLTQILEAKLKIDVPQAVEDLMKDKALQLCAWAEEKAEDKLLNKGGTPTSGAEKAEQVITALLTFADSMGYGKQWQREKVEQLVSGIVHLNREGSEGVIGSNGNRGKELAEKAAPVGDPK